MPMFRKKPVVIEARLFDGDDLESHEALASWCSGKLCGIQLAGRSRVIMIQTHEGEMEASHGDWIIKGVKGEFYPCKPDIFALIYDPTE